MPWQLGPRNVLDDLDEAELGMADEVLGMAGARNRFPPLRDHRRVPVMEFGGGRPRNDQLDRLVLPGAAGLVQPRLRPSGALVEVVGEQRAHRLVAELPLEVGQRVAGAVELGPGDVDLAEHAVGEARGDIEPRRAVERVHAPGCSAKNPSSSSTTRSGRSSAR